MTSLSPLALWLTPYHGSFFNKIEIMTIRIPKVKNLLTARPEGMDYETYKRLRTEQNKMLHGWNETVMDGGKQFVRHYPGRLAGGVHPAGAVHQLA